MFILNNEGLHTKIMSLPQRRKRAGGGGGGGEGGFCRGPFFWVQRKSVFLYGKEKMARMEHKQDIVNA